MKLLFLSEMGPISRRNFMATVGKGASIAASMPQSVFAGSAGIGAIKDALIARYDNALEDLGSGSYNSINDLISAYNESGALNRWCKNHNINGKPIRPGEKPLSNIEPGIMDITVDGFRAYIRYLADNDKDKLLSLATCDDPFIIDNSLGGFLSKLIDKIISNWSPKQLFDHVAGLYGDGIDDAALAAIQNYCSFSKTLSSFLPMRILDRARDEPELAANLYKRYGNLDDTSLREYVKEKRNEKIREKENKNTNQLNKTKTDPAEYDLDRWSDDGGRTFESKLNNALGLLV